LCKYNERRFKKKINFQDIVISFAIKIIIEMLKEMSKIPIIDPETCISCDKCLEICPHQVISKNNSDVCSKCIKYCISMEVPCNPDFYIFHYDKCDNCGLCIEICPTNSIIWFEKRNQNPEK